MPMKDSQGAVILYLLVKGLTFTDVHRTLGRYRVTSRNGLPPNQLRASPVNSWTCVEVQTLCGEYGGPIGNKSKVSDQDRRGSNTPKLSAQVKKEREDQTAKSLSALRELFSEGASAMALYLEVPFQPHDQVLPRLEIPLTVEALLSVPENMLVELRR